MDEPLPAEPDHWFEPLADYLGSAYLRYSFTMGTRQEVDAVVDALGLSPGARILDVGCGPGRHSHELARRGMRVHGIDIAGRFVELARAGAPEGATFQRLDARNLPFVAEFDAAICLCQGAFGLMTAGGDDARVLEGISRALRPGGRLALSVFSAYFAVKYHDEAEFDADTGIAHERTEIRNDAGVPLETDLWTACYTPRELRLLCASVGLEVDEIWSVTPGDYARRPPSTETPEYLVLAHRW